ncbi:MAG: NAD(P)/FAD-dependent oxidoreductase [Deltaproteobacteria bacterium]|nr:NAD(P)/FAD-dependent oxidoreductase [Deltaproteobacteria bacterium]
MNHHSSRYDVAIVGGGVVGCAIARELSRFELKTVVIEKEAEVGFGTTKSNSGIIHAGHQSPAGTLKGTLEVRGNRMYDRLCEELGFGFSRIGELVVAMVPEDLAVLDELKKLGESRGVPGLEIWDKARLHREEPNLAKNLLGALYAPTAGVINPYEFVFSLIESALANGVTLEIDSPVEKIDTDNHGLTLHTPHKSIQSRFVLNCAGVFADRIAQMAGVGDFSIRPRKGEEYMLDKRLKGLVRRLIFPVPQKTTKGTLIIPTFDGTIMVGPTACDVDDREDLATTYEGSDEIFNFVRRLCPSIGERDTITEFAGLRAVSSTNDFIIGPTKIKGFINVAGIQSPGLTASPAIAEYVVEILKKEGLSLIPKKNFLTHVKGPARFALQHLEAQKELIQKDPRFARVICRCELVTEAEIHEAIDHGARTLDGIKFRSRAGMGRCQGGFCTSRCIDILSKRLNCPPTAITKRGGGSWVIKEMDS